MPDMAWAVVEYPLAGLEPAQLEAKVEHAYPKIVELLTGGANGRRAAGEVGTLEEPGETVRITGDTVNGVLESLSAGFSRLRWSDGLPLVPPTREAVEAMLAGVALPRDEVIGLLYPDQGKATVEKIAINAVMAGCRPEHMPILVAAIGAITTPAYCQEQNLLSTGSLFPVVIVNGPIAKRVQVNAGRGAFGPGWRANASIGRAIRLMIINIGHSWPDVNDMGVMGHPARYTCCVAENEAASPWPSLADELGHAKDTSTATVMPGLFMGYFSTVGGSNPEDVLQPLCEQLCSAHTTSSVALRSQTLVVLNPVHAAMLSGMGFGKNDVKRFVYENTRLPAEKYARMARLAVEEDAKRRKTISTWPGATVAMHESPDRLRVIVAGAEGTQGLFIRGFLGDMVTCEVPPSRGTAAGRV
jgi:hypothetical protein